DMLRKTHTPMCPWTIIRADDKPKARINAMRIILNSVDYPERNQELDFVPESDVVISASRELEHMNAERISRGEFVNPSTNDE
ncbi:MAG: polyphosphate kinase 2, partial [Magnetococcales bacterium]|nr:polyphosphate kinase 2 [Magnetococcales bacterium]